MAAKIGFRVASIALDADEEVEAVTAVADLRTLGVIREFIPDAQWTFRGEMVNEVTLPRQDMLKLHSECGKLNGLDPRQEVTYAIYDSLCRVVFGLMDDD